MEFTAHPSTEGFVYQLMLLNPGFALEIRCCDLGVIVIAVASEVVDDNIGSWQSIDNQCFDIFGFHRHSVVTTPLSDYLSSDIKPGSQLSCLSVNLPKHMASQPESVNDWLPV